MSVPERVLLADMFPNSAAARASLAEAFDKRFGHGWTPGIYDAENRTIAVIQERPGATRWSLAADFRGSAVDTLAEQVRQQGYDLAEVNVGERYAIVAHFDPAQRAIRNRLASALGCRPWEVEVAVEYEGQRVDLVQVLRYPDKGLDDDKYLDFWRSKVTAIPGGHRDWLVQRDPVSHRVVLTRRDPLVLPDQVDLVDVLPDHMDPERWANVTLGLSPEGTPLGFDLTLGPHALLVGPTGSGKTIAILALVASNLLHGHDVAIIDPTKGGLDFLSLRPYCVGFAEDYDQSIALINAIYDEGQRRKAVLRTHEEVKWSDLSEDVRERENIRPLTVVVDELYALMRQPSVPKGLDRDHPLVVKANALISAKAEISEVIGSIARELRFVGVHLVVATQRPDANVLGGELRSNLTSAAQLAKPGKVPARQALAMVFEGDEVDEAEQTLRNLDNGHSRGLAVAAGDGGELSAIRVAYAPMKSLPALLDARGARRVTPWEIDVNSRDTPSDLELPDLFEAFDDDSPAPAGEPFQFSLDL